MSKTKRHSVQQICGTNMKSTVTVERYGSENKLHDKQKHPEPARGDKDNFVATLHSDGIPCVELLQHFHRHRTFLYKKDHTHPNCVEFILCGRGQFEMHCDGRNLTVRSGELVIIAPTSRHHISLYKDNLVYHNLTVRMNTPHPILRLPKNEAAFLHDALAALTTGVFRPAAEVPKLFHRLVQTCRDLPPGPRRSLELRTLVTRLLLKLIDSAHFDAADDPSDDRQLTEIIDEIRRDPGARHNLDRFADRAGMSYSKFNGLFKKLTGLPPHAFILTERLSKSRDLLATGQPLEQIARTLGFSSARHFITKFKRAYNITPGKFMRP